ncbi:4-phosphoerythronate dehydrogenase [Shewanella submarina]|uniref:Erythronate-4-phosphate dehydrogenase n=1 Tax=Shewanella submarina TaxID=2016376 RepID=A0ABV7G9T4_9GAMM|nr:4-phosphoerythronate dehydrogenase [Shewanella submarina]MCL1039935.1 4-phosphoerythronate dehydrogenase [Shewanella submarina]
MKIIADENMPYVEQVFADIGEVSLVNGRQLSAEQLEGADVLLVRSVTQVNAQLLAHNDSLKFVGSATIGTDHIDAQLLAQKGIPFSNAPGCNAIAVGEYAFIAMLELAAMTGSSLKQRTVGIVGAGNTGSQVARCLEAYGVKTLLCDPVQAASGDSREFHTLDELIASCDVISLHVPLTKGGIEPTWYLLDEARLSALKPDAWLLNCCRGEVIDNRALFRVKQQRADLKLVLDVWEGEPNPMPELVPLVDIATPHIAGYSLEGKARGTTMLHSALSQVLNIEPENKLDGLLPVHVFSRIKLENQPDEGALLQLCRLIYDLRDDDRKFRANYALAGGFDQLRKNHTHRREFSALALVKGSGFEVDWLTKLGFSGASL